MCGIVGIALFRPAQQRALLDSMIAAVHHRGPDDEGQFESPAQGVALGMTRLSIIDVAGGHQPMFDESKRYALVFNGEIYNFRDLWAELAELGHRFSSDHSDTEVIVHGYEEWGSAVFPRLNGMFAVAVWDSEASQVILARDRAGEKPLYVGRLANGGWVFGSELKALLVHPDLDRAIDANALEEFLAFDFVIGPRTILRSVSKVPAGSVATITSDGYHVSSYWSPRQTTVPRSSGETQEELDRLLRKSVDMRMVADVPVGLFLSGGLDSTTIGWYMAQTSSRVRAFSIGFDDPDFDESREAKLAAAHLGVSLDLRIFSPVQVVDLVPRVTDLLDEPMGDQSIFPTHLLSVVAREHVKVALGGDGSDELLMGYRTYQALKVAWMIDAMPGARGLATLTARLLPGGSGMTGRARRFARALDLQPEERLLSRLGSFHGASQWVLARPVREAIGVPALARSARQIRGDAEPGLGGAERTVHAYLRGYLQEDILVKVDRASMAASLEVRSPFLDPELMDFALSISPRRKLRGFTRKDPLRGLMRGRIPDSLIDRPKRGFGVPLNAWMRRELAPMIRDYLAPGRIAAAGIFDGTAVAAIVSAHLGGNEEAGHQTWLLLQFELWRERWLESAANIVAD